LGLPVPNQVPNPPAPFATLSMVNLWLVAGPCGSSTQPTSMNRAYSSFWVPLAGQARTRTQGASDRLRSCPLRAAPSRPSLLSLVVSARALPFTTSRWPPTRLIWLSPNSSCHGAHPPGANGFSVPAHAPPAGQISWFAVDLGHGRALFPSAYTLRHGKEDGTDALRSWELQVLP
jgi:hypothetical protein